METASCQCLKGTFPPLRPGKDTYCIRPTPRCGAGWLSTAVTAKAERKDNMRTSGGLDFGTSNVAHCGGFHSPASITHSPCKRLCAVSPDTLWKWSFSGTTLYPLERDSVKSSNSLQELTEEQRLRKLSTRGRRGPEPGGSRAGSAQLVLVLHSPTPTSSSWPLTRGAAVSRAVGCVPSAGHSSGRPGLARPRDGRTVPASSTTQSVPLLLLPEKRQETYALRPNLEGKGAAVPPPPSHSQGR